MDGNGNSTLRHDGEQILPVSQASVPILLLSYPSSPRLTPYPVRHPLKTRLPVSCLKTRRPPTTNRQPPTTHPLAYNIISNSSSSSSGSGSRKPLRSMNPQHQGEGDRYRSPTTTATTSPQEISASQRRK